jgi:hypothetical protein
MRLVFEGEDMTMHHLVAMGHRVSGMTARAGRLSIHIRLGFLATKAVLSTPSHDLPRPHHTQEKEDIPFNNRYPYRSTIPH